MKVDIKAFLDDFVHGRSDEELREKYALDPRRLAKTISLLKTAGRITPDHADQRAENLKIRFGSESGPPDPGKDSARGVDLDTGLVLHCPACGASVQRNAGSCEYCSAHLDFSLKGKTSNCPHCAARIAAESRFCMTCGRPVPEIAQDGTKLEDRLCPRCEVPMYARRIGEFSVVECDRCQGFFVPPETFEMMQDKPPRVIIPSDDTTRREPALESHFRYLRCPACRKMMNRKNFAAISGVIIDTCRGHGVWFDPGELEKIMDFVARGGLQKAKEVQLEGLKAQESLMKLRSPLHTDQAAPEGSLVGGTLTAGILSELVGLIVEGGET